MEQPRTQGLLGMEVIASKLKNLFVKLASSILILIVCHDKRFTKFVCTIVCTHFFARFLFSNNTPEVKFIFKAYKIRSVGAGCSKAS